MSSLPTLPCRVPLSPFCCCFCFYISGCLPICHLFVLLPPLLPCPGAWCLVLVSYPSIFLGVCGKRRQGLGKSPARPRRQQRQQVGQQRAGQKPGSIVQGRAAFSEVRAMAWQRHFPRRLFPFNGLLRRLTLLYDGSSVAVPDRGRRREPARRRS
ncbi:unnamed protein product, partial [Ectocarpus sp. 4 AP-2014]